MATMHRENLASFPLSEKNIESSLLIVNQADHESIETNGSVRMLSNTERGSSLSRNLAIENAIGDICVIADDDVSYLDGYEQVILDAYSRYPDADLITFQIQTTEGKPFKDGYINREMVHNELSILKCASIEITFRREAIKKSGLLLDKEFGLGSKYRVHDEIIFLKDALDAGLKCVYIPTPIVIHPPESSGTDITYELLYSKGAAFYRLFGVRGYLFDIAFTIKKYQLIKHRFSFFSSLRIMLKGTFEYSREHKK
ncbi:glycosyltransferase family 2 protein [Vibrio sp. D404a]|uniref:glycosyltransferase family 2 protein n=1 Tax=unclassified Vibrio TaxID=2614977 RepID=UPI0025529E27|nr:MULTISPECIES: glycosyltransferase family A protein [unclassified Vibrio]MDK9737702.1 glycosyltransferase family 2 protein [Vibrio sp. D404a]MDK9795304.1 glycosyltransferase family 2 protein [Vibrio sp. D449a]